MEERKTAEDQLLVIWRGLVVLFTRLTVWGLLLFALYLLRSFFLLIFLTFIFAYIQNRAVERGRHMVRHRSLRAVLVGIIFLALIVGIGGYIGPSVADQARLFAANYSSYTEAVDRQLRKLGEQHPMLYEIAPQLKEAQNHGSSPEGRPVSARLLEQAVGLGESSAGGENIRRTLEALRDVGGLLLKILSAFLLALLFSFLIVLDLPRLTSTVRTLEFSRIGFAYSEVSGSIYSFGSILGSALEAQFYIALINTILTGAGLWVLGITAKAALLLMIVFFCSFIPIAGVFISSVPIGVIALQEGGLSLLLLAITMIIAVHLIEAYVLNPRIFGHHFRINPVIVLIILTLSGELFGAWGLVLGLPVATYIFRHAIQWRGAVGEAHL